MAVDNNSFFQYNETRAQSGYKSAWLVKRPNATEYSLVGLTESVPYVFGDKDTYEFDILQSDSKGRVEGKMTLDPQDVEVLHHRDNAYRFGKLKEAGTLDFMVINSEFVGYKFTGTIDYRPNSAEADIHRATVTITPMYANATPILNARSLVQETLCFKYSVPPTIKANESVDLAVEQTGAVLSFDIVKISGESNDETAATANTDYKVDTLNKSKITLLTSGLYAITASASNYASWTTTVYVE